MTVVRRVGATVLLWCGLVAAWIVHTLIVQTVHERRDRRRAYGGVV